MKDLWHKFKECINSLASDDHTGMDSFHECLQEYGEGLEVVQICLEPEEASIKEDEISALGDISLEDCKKDHTFEENIKEKMEFKKDNLEKVNGVTDMKFSKSDESLDEQDDDMTITEDDVLITPRDLLDLRSKSADNKGSSEEGCLSKDQSKDISTSDEMVFAVTPTGLERISFDKYWKESDSKKPEKTTLEKMKSDESWKECLNSPTDTSSFYDTTTRISVQEENSSLLFIDHEIDGYETCVDEDSSSVREKQNRKVNGDHEIKERCKQNKIAVKNKDNDSSANNIKTQIIVNSVEDATPTGRLYIQEHIIKQMKSLRIEPLNVNISYKKMKKRSPTKPSKEKRQCVEYYNDQAECLEEIRQKKLEEQGKKREAEIPIEIVQQKKKQLKRQEPSEESTDLETSYVHGCHKCFLENYAYAITKAYIAEASACKYCDVIKNMLEPPKCVSNRRMSAPALVKLESPGTETEDEDLLMVPMVKGRRKSAGPLNFLVPSRRPSFVPQAVMTVTKQAQRWGPVRRVTLKRSPGTALGVSIVGGKVDIVSGYDGDDTDGKTIYGIFIKNVVPESPAGKSGDLHTGDRILEVDGVNVRAAQHDRAVQLIKAAGEKVTLTVQSLVSWNSDSSDAASPPFSPAIHTASKSPARTISQSSTRSPSIRSLKKSAPLPSVVVNGTPEHEIKITVTSEPDSEKEKEPEENKDESSKPVYSDSEESSEEEDERELSGRTYSDKGVEIDRASAGNIKRTREEKEKDKEEEDDFGYTMNKIKKKYGPLGETIVVVKLERTAKAGLGLSLAGHRDRTRMAVFVCGMHPAGSAAKAQPPVRVGDEILEVNGIVLHGRCHLNASAIIKGLLGPVFKFILLRRKAALEDVAVKPLTHFPVAIDEDDSERYAGYKGVRDITIKKGPSGLGIMIIEGRHQEAGHGIFVSDLQEGSAAEQAGLNIGDMILAVNKDCLLDVNYDQAAAKLKQTDGVVILTVCSPNLKDDKKVEDGGTSGTDAPPDPSRPTTPRPAPSPAKAEPPADPATAPINPNQDTVIEIATNNEILGVVLLGGSDTKINGNAAIILDLYKNGAFAKDGRLKPGDQIMDCNGVQINKDMVHERIKMTIKQKHPKFRMTVHRPEPLQYEDIEVELNRKAGKVLGLECVAPVSGTGVYIQELTAGSAADVDGRLQRGDFIAAVDGKDMTGADYLAVAAALKLCGNKAVIKAKRFKTVR